MPTDRALLDVNVLVALLDPDHVFHTRAWDWLARNQAAGWASCPITQNGCVRIMSQPSYPNSLSTALVIDRLASAVADPSHEFWSADLSILNPLTVDGNRVLGPRQITDIYLLALAVHHAGRFVTFDSGIPISAVRGAIPAHLVVI